MKKTWKAVSVSKYFTPIRGHEGNMAGLESGNVPLVSARNVNNGLKTFVSNPSKIVEGNVISLNNDGDGGAGLAYYQPFSMALDTHVTALVPHDELNANTQLYTACCLSGLHEFFGHGRSISNARVRRIKFMLPIAEDGLPDWEYMSSVINDLRERLLIRYKEYAARRISELEYKEIPNLDEIEWQPFAIEDIFTISPGKRLEKRNMGHGQRPFIGASDSNNGVTSFVNNKNESLDSNVLGINYNGSVCEAFYHPYECIFSDDVKRLHLKHKADSEALLLFMGVAIRQQKVKYQYAYKFNEQRMKRQAIMLPVSNDGTPDYNYMEQYATNMMLCKYKQYLTYMGCIET